jgi:hypothetical protein
LDFVDEVGLDYQASKLKFLLLAGHRWKPDSGISAGNFCRKVPAAGSVNELFGMNTPTTSTVSRFYVRIILDFTNLMISPSEIKVSHSLVLAGCVYYEKCLDQYMPRTTACLPLQWLAKLAAVVHSDGVGYVCLILLEGHVANGKFSDAKICKVKTS